MEKIVTKSKTVTTSEEDIEDIRRLQGWETTRQCMFVFYSSELAILYASVCPKRLVIYF